ncbi:MAG TPA: hypothetical protein VGJ02_07605 [Pyrinomonadaceae bacterium]
MKIFSAALLLTFAGMAVVAQTEIAPRVVVTPSISTRIITESGSSIVKGSPFSAEAVSESVQTLADGNRIVRQWNEKLYRSTDGKFRREGSGTPGAAFGSYIIGDSGVSITDPVGGFRYSFDLNSNSNTARMSRFRVATPALFNGEGKAFTIIQNGNADMDKAAVERAVVAAKAATAQAGGIDITPSGETMPAVAELRARAAELKAVAVADAKLATLAVPAMPGMPAMPAMLDSQKWDTHTEQLGTQNFEGVDADGTRTTTTIPVGAIGNEQPILIVYERWYSKELKMIVYSKHSDPRFGEQTYRLTDVNRSEPDPSLFQPPPGFKVVSSNAPSTYRLVEPRAAVKALPVKNVSTTTVTKP